MPALSAIASGLMAHGGPPIIEHVLATLRKAGIGQMAISANGRTHTIAAKLGYNPAPDISVHYSEDAMPRGPPAASRIARTGSEMPASSSSRAPAFCSVSISII